jgi:signal transduction histidine kinase
VNALDLAIGALEILLAAAAFFHLRRLSWASPWLFALGAFFLLRGVERGGHAFAVEAPEELGVAADTLLGAVLMLLLVGHVRLARGVGRTLESALFREAEYRRALTDYRILARHRLANPITAIQGSVQTLRSLKVDQEIRDELLDTIGTEAERLAKISLEPDGELQQEERRLQPVPRLEG